MMELFNDTIKKLGFGFMRLPRIGDDFDLQKINQMVDIFMSNGYSYFDTAYLYKNSEKILRESLVKRYPRSRYQIATKLPIYTLNSSNTPDFIFNNSMLDLGVEYIDYYMLHAINLDLSRKAEEFGVWKYIVDLKNKGLVKHIGFSFHGSSEDLEEIIIMHPEVEFVQLQINYIDWDDPKIQSRKLYEIAIKYDKPIIVMEPVKGGLLSSSSLSNVLKTANPDMSVASWALRFVASLKGISMILSGMNTIEQMNDNIKTMECFRMLSDYEMNIILNAVSYIKESPKIPCTGCGYCMTNCPKSINIPMFIDLYNDYLIHKTIANLKHTYDIIAEDSNKTSSCVACGSCEKHCPQSIKLINILSDMSKVFD